MAATVREIARAAGVSAAAVSLVLNNKPNRISQAKRAEILRLARELDYRPRPAQQGDRPLLGLVLPDLRNFFFAGLAAGADQAAGENGWGLLVLTAHDRPESDLAQLELLRRCGARAAMLVVSSRAGPRWAAQYQQAIARFGGPVVLTDRLLLAPGCSAVLANHQKGGYLAAQHLLSLGHRRIALLTGPARQDARMEGVRAAFAQAGAELEEAALFVGDYSTQAGERAGGEILGQGFTAAFCFNDMMAYGLHSFCRARGVRVPEDFSLVGYDDVFGSALLETPLTTVRQPPETLGAQACLRALAEAEGAAGRQQILLDPTLCVRKSTAAPK